MILSTVAMQEVLKHTQALGSNPSLTERSWAKLGNLSKPQSPHLQNESYKSADLLGRQLEWSDAGKVFN